VSTRAILEGLTVRLDLERGAIAELVRAHASLWALENRAREPGANAESLAMIKREIDRENALRHATIDRIDARVDIGAAAAGGRLYGQTVGELIDVLVVLQRKLDALARLAADPRLAPARRDECSARLAMCRAKAEHMGRLADQLAIDVLAGRAALPPRADPKLYNDVELRALSRRPAP
jgi:Protein of unknown function (DUF4254)